MTKLFTSFWNTLHQKWKKAPIALVELEDEIVDFDLSPFLGWMEEEQQGNLSV